MRGFADPGRLPKLRGERGPADPRDLPRQRRGVTPQMHGRYPDYDVLEQAKHWDDVTRRVVLDRIERVPELQFFGEEEAATLTAFADVVTGQDGEPRIPVLAYVDEKLYEGRLDGFQYADLPDDRETWRLVAAGLDEASRAEGAASFAAASLGLQLDVCRRFAEGALEGGTWERLSVKRAWSVVMRSILAAFYSHPWAWNEIGFGGPAYPRGYARFGTPHLPGAEREAWEGKEAFELDPVKDVKERGLE